MLKLELKHSELMDDAKIKRTSVLRILFDMYIYKHVTREDLSLKSKAALNKLVQIQDHGLSTICVRINNGRRA